MLKRNVAVILVAGLVVAGGALAWAEGGPARPTVLAAAQEGGAAGGTPPTPAERQARRAEVRACMEKAGADPAARRACLTAAGLPPAGGREHHGRPGPFEALGKAVHGTLLVPGENGSWQTVTFDRGIVDEATDASKIVLDRRDGHKATLALTPDTRYRGIAGASDIREGRPALVVSKDGKATQVVQLHLDHAERPGRGNNGEAPIVPND